MTELHLVMVLFKNLRKLSEQQQNQSTKMRYIQCSICTFLVQIRSKFSAHFSLGSTLFEPNQSLPSHLEICLSGTLIKLLPIVDLNMNRGLCTLRISRLSYFKKPLKKFTKINTGIILNATLLVLDYLMVWIYDFLKSYLFLELEKAFFIFFSKYATVLKSIKVII